MQQVATSGRGILPRCNPSAFERQSMKATGAFVSNVLDKKGVRRKRLEQQRKEAAGVISKLAARVRGCHSYDQRSQLIKTLKGQPLMQVIGSCRRLFIKVQRLFSELISDQISSELWTIIEQGSPVH